MEENGKSKGMVTHTLDTRSGSWQVGGLAAWLALPLLAACPASGDDVRPPRDQFFFPTGLALSPDESVLFVGNANSELRYDSGSVVVVDLDKVETYLDPWLTGNEVPQGADCESDELLPHILQCNEGELVLGDSGVRIGNFATDMGVQELASGDLRLFVAVRGDPSVTWIDYASASRELSCEGSGPVPLCDGPNRLLYLRDDPALGQLAGEPFGVYVDSANAYAMVTHLSLAAVTLIDAPADGRAPVLADMLIGLFEADPNTGERGAVGVAGRQPGSEGDLVYVTSRSEDRVQMLYVFRPGDPALSPVLMPSEHFFLNAIAPSDDSRGIAFGSDGSRAYIVNRDPPTLQVFDTADDGQGFPRNEIVGSIEICRDPANVVIADVGRGERAYVTCFSSGQIWVVDPENQRVDAIVDVGRGPHALALADDRRRLLVANFLDDTIAVVDLTPGAKTENRVVLRLGRSRQSGGE